VIPILTWKVAQNSPRLDRLLGNLAYPLYLFIGSRVLVLQLRQRSDQIWKPGRVTVDQLPGCIGRCRDHSSVVDQPPPSDTLGIGAGEEDRKLGGRIQGVASRNLKT
jgi:hypothetical protein